MGGARHAHHQTRSRQWPTRRLGLLEARSCWLCRGLQAGITTKERVGRRGRKELEGQRTGRRATLCHRLSDLQACVRLTGTQREFNPKTAPLGPSLIETQSKRPRRRKKNGATSCSSGAGSSSMLPPRGGDRGARRHARTCDTPCATSSNMSQRPPSSPPTKPTVPTWPFHREQILAPIPRRTEQSDIQPSPRLSGPLRAV